MKKYGKFKPTQFDRAGAFLPDQSEWLVAPVSQTRDSSALERSNFEVVLRDLGGESDDVQVHRFCHWGPGWYEIILINPAREDLVAKGEDWESALSDYPVADETHFSQLEYDEACKYWESMRVKDRVEVLQRFGGNIFQARHDCLPRDDNGAIFNYLTR